MKLSSIPRKILRRVLPIQVSAVLSSDRPTDIDPAFWDQEYVVGRWDYLASLSEMPRYAVIIGYIEATGPAASVLDIGCGTGILLDRLGRNTEGSYLGLDISSAAIEQARARATRPGRFELADIMTYDPGELFDVIVMNEMLYFVKDPEQWLKRCASFLKPDGVFVISMFTHTFALRVWPRCKPHLVVLDEIRLRRTRKLQWDVRLCKPGVHQTGSSSNSAPV